MSLLKNSFMELIRSCLMISHAFLKKQELNPFTLGALLSFIPKSASFKNLNAAGINLATLSHDVPVNHHKISRRRTLKFLLELGDLVMDLSYGIELLTISILKIINTIRCSPLFDGSREVSSILVPIPQPIDSGFLMESHVFNFPPPSHLHGSFSLSLSLVGVSL